MRKKFIKSSRPTYKKRIKKAQQGMRFVSYNPVSNPTIDYTDITNPINPFSEYNYNTTYDKPEALVVPVRDTNEPDVVANNPIAEPVINKPVASKSVTDKPVTANSTWKSPYTNRKQWSTELINAYKKAGITNDNAIRMLLAQDALESSWGKSAQGKYNFGNLTTGSSWKGDYVTGNDKNAKGEAIKQKFRSYNSMDEYAADKIQFLKRLYDFDENDDINKFVAKLTGSNKGKRRYAEATNYAKVLTGVYNGIPKGENGMIIKYQNPPHGIARRDAIKDYRPNIPNRIRKATPAEHIQSMINIYGQSEQPTVTSDAKSPWQHQQAHEAASKGYDDYMQAKKYEEGLHNLNGILTFTDYATLATGLGSLLSKGASMAGRYAGKQMAKRAVGKEFKRQADAFVRPLERQRFMETATSMRGNSDVKMNMRNFVEYLLKPETQKRVANIDAELGTKYGEAISEFVKKYKAGELKVTPRTKGELDVFGDVIKKSQTSPSEAFLQSGSYDDIFFDILKRDPAHVPGHEAKHGIEMVNAALTKGIMTEEEYLKFMRSESPRLQALMKDNIVSEDEFVKRIMKEHPDYNEVSVRNRYKYLTSPTEFNSQLHPLIEFEQRAGKSGVPNFKSVDEIDRLINNNPYVGTSENNGLRNLRLLFNYIIKDKNEFMRRFNKYGFGTAVGVPTAATINNYDNE